MPTVGCRGPAALSCLCFCADTCPAGQRFIQKYLFCSPVFTITTAAAAAPGMKGRGCAAADLSRCVLTHRYAHRGAGESGCAVSRSWALAVCLPWGQMSRRATGISAPSWLLLLNPCRCIPPATEQGWGLALSPGPQHRQLPGLRWPVQRQPCCCRSSEVC